MRVVGDARKQLELQVRQSMKQIVVKTASSGDLTPIETLIWDAACAAVEEIVIMHATGPKEAE